MLLRHLILEHLGPLQVSQLPLFLLKLLLQVRNRLVLQTGGLLQIAASLGLFELPLGLFHLLLEGLDVVDPAFFRLPLGGQRAVSLFEVRHLLFDVLEPLFAGRIGLFFEGLPLDLELHDPAADAVQLGGQRVILEPQLGGGLINQVDRLIRQPPIGDVPIRQHRCRHNGRIRDAHAVMSFVAVLQSAQDGDGVLDTWRVDHDRLEAALQGRILLNVLAVLVDGRGPDAAELAPGQRRLEQVARVHGPFRLAGTDHDVQFVDKQDDLPLRGDDLFQHGFEPVFELAAELRAGDQRTHIESDHPLILQSSRHIARDDSLRQTFDDGGLADTRLADQHRVVLGPAVEDLHATANLLIPADHRVELAFAGHLDQINAVAFQGLVLILRVLIGDLGAAANVL